MKVDISKWELKTLGDVCTFKRGLTYPKTEESAVITSNVVLRSNNIDLNTCALVFNELKYLSDLYNIPNERKLVKDSILMCMSNGSSAHIGKVAYIDKDYDYAFGGFMGLIIPNNINPKFLYYKYRSESFKTFLGKIGNGINITNLKFSTISPLPIYVPTLAEQEIIVRELNALQEMIDGYNAQLHDLDELIKSIFNNTFGDIHSNPYNFDIKLMQDVCSKITDGTHNPPKFVDSGIPFIFVSNIANYEISYLAKKHIDDASYNELWKSTPVEVGDVVYTSVGSYGNPAIVRTDKKFMFQRHIALLKPKHDVIESEYLKWFLISPSGREQADNKAIGAAQKTLNLKAIKSFKIIVPPKEKQLSFTAQVEILEKQRTLLREQLADAEQLMAERMQYYFS